MAPRVDSELLLVGSLPADSTEAALRAGVGVLRRPRLRAAGRRDRAAGGVGRLRARAADDAEPGVRARRGDRVADRHPAPRVRDADLQGARRRRRCAGTRGRASTTRSSPTGRSARFATQGVDPARAALPDRAAVPVERAERAQGRLRRATTRPPSRRSRTSSRRELERLTSEIPPAELAIQWDVCYEVQDIEGVVAWMGGGDAAWERFTGPGRPPDAAASPRTCSSATTSATARSRSGRCTRRATWA